MTISTTIETINGKPYTVIRKPFDAEWVREQLVIEQSVLAEKSRGKLFTLWNCVEDNFQSGGGDFHRKEDFTHIITILPPLPRNPKPDDVKEVSRVLYLYGCHNIFLHGTTIEKGRSFAIGGVCTIIKSIIDGGTVTIEMGELNGNPVKVAIV